LRKYLEDPVAEVMLKGIVKGASIFLVDHISGQDELTFTMTNSEELPSEDKEIEEKINP